jgi:hypothetical protein
MAARSSELVDIMRRTRSFRFPRACLRRLRLQCRRHRSTLGAIPRGVPLLHRCLDCRGFGLGGAAQVAARDDLLLSHALALPRLNDMQKRVQFCDNFLQPLLNKLGQNATLTELAYARLFEGRAFVQDDGLSRASLRLLECGASSAVVGGGALSGPRGTQLRHLDVSHPPPLRGLAAALDRDTPCATRLHIGGGVACGGLQPGCSGWGLRRE